MAGESHRQPFFVGGMDDDRGIYGLEARQGRHPRPWFFEPPSSDVKTLSVSRKPMLADLLKHLGGEQPIYCTSKRRDGFFGYVTAKVYDVRRASRFQDLYACSNGSFPTRPKAEEKAADDLIRSLNRMYNFEVNDINWQEKQQYNLDRFDLWEEARALRRKIRILEDMSDSLANGWSTTLRLLKPVRQMASITRESAASAIAVLDLTTDETVEVLNNAGTVEEYIGRATEQGTRALQKASIPSI